MATTQIIVIGSGFGGAVAAARLVEAGLAVTLIERGPWRDTVPVRSMGIAARAPFPHGRGALKRLIRSIRGNLLPGGSITVNRKGLFEIHFGKGLHVVSSSGVGGGSHVYAGLNMRPPDPTWWDQVALEVSADSMEAHYQYVLQRMGSRAPMADDQLPNTMDERFGDSDVIDAHGADYELQMGFEFPQSPGAPRKVATDDGVERWEARPGEDGNLGSEGGGKTSVDFAFLARAMKRGLTVLDQCEVSEIRKTERGYDVHFKNHHSGQSETCSAARVVLAAGTMNTLRLLFASQESGGLATMPALGHNFGGNGDFFGYWKLDDGACDLSQSMPVRGLLRVKQEHALGEDRAWPMIAEGALPPPQALPLGGWVSRMLRSGTFVAGMGADAQDGKVSYRRGKLKIDYRAEGSDIFARIKDAFRFIGEKTGKRIFHFETPITVHPTGGACIGTEPAGAVVDGRGEVFANPGLFVADAAAFPKPVAGPPSMTIAAWADHVAESLVASSLVEQHQ